MPKAEGAPKAKAKSLADLFGSKAKKKPKAMNMNAEKPPPPAPKPVRVVAEKKEGDVEGWARALQKDQELLKSCGLFIREVEADGACLFRAFAEQLDGGDGSEHAAYRERCVDFIKAHRGDFEPFLEEDFDEYCRRMREPKTWGGHVEVQALSRDLGVNAIIYQPTEAGRPQALLSSCVEMTSSDEASRTVQLSFHPQHHAGSHYNSVRCLGDEGEGPATLVGIAEVKRRIEDALKPPVKEVAEEVPKAAVHAKARAKVF